MEFKPWCPYCKGTDLRYPEPEPLYSGIGLQPLVAPLRSFVPHCHTCGKSQHGVVYTFSVESPDDRKVKTLPEHRRDASRTRIFYDIRAEATRQDERFGPERCLSALLWQCVLGEEYGEVCRAVLERDPGPHLREELVQLAAVATQLIDAIDDGRYTPREVE
jgi:hypothetical protein